jgi:hypothetical protein
VLVIGCFWLNLSLIADRVVLALAARLPVAQTAKPDKDCAFNPDGLAKCKPDPTTGKCPSGFSANDKGNCFPKGPCPTGYARLDNDESGKCFRISS